MYASYFLLNSCCIPLTSAFAPYDEPKSLKLSIDIRAFITLRVTVPFGFVSPASFLSSITAFSTSASKTALIVTLPVL